MRAPNDESAKLIAALELIRAAAYKSFTDRRDYEWKFCITLWTVITIYVSALVVGPVETGKALGVAGWPLFVGTVVASLLLFVVHWHWTIGIARANALNLEMFDQLTEEMRAILEFQWNEGIRKRILAIVPTRDAERHRHHWSHSAELAITILLGALASFAAWYRANVFG